MALTGPSSEIICDVNTEFIKRLRQEQLREQLISDIAELVNSPGTINADSIIKIIERRCKE